MDINGEDISEGLEAPAPAGYFTDMIPDFGDYMDWSEQSRVDKLLTVIDSPRLLVQHLTIHYAAEDKYMRLIYILLPISVSVFLISAFQCEY